MFGFYQLATFDHRRPENVQELNGKQFTPTSATNSNSDLILKWGDEGEDPATMTRIHWLDFQDRSFTQPHHKNFDFLVYSSEINHALFFKKLAGTSAKEWGSRQASTLRTATKSINAADSQHKTKKFYHTAPENVSRLLLFCISSPVAFI
jgi:hypothetical protein